MTVTILPFTPGHAADFDRLNRSWIEHYFTVEPFDDLVLTQPEKMIIAPGGEIWFGALDGDIVGACALLNYAPGVYEFTKLGVDARARGHGVARALLRFCRDRATEKGAHTLKIFTNTSLKPANTLYVSEGFVEIPLTEAERSRYQRCDIIYDLKLA